MNTINLTSKQSDVLEVLLEAQIASAHNDIIVFKHPMDVLHLEILEDILSELRHELY